MPIFRSRKDSQTALPHLLRLRLAGLNSRLPGYALLVGALLRRRSVPATYSRALAEEAGFGRMPTRVPGRMLPGFRNLGKVAIVGVLLHVFLRQRSAGTCDRGRMAAGLSATGLRDDAQTLIVFARWVLSAVMGRRSRLGSET